MSFDWGAADAIDEIGGFSWPHKYERREPSGVLPRPTVPKRRGHRTRAHAQANRFTQTTHRTIGFVRHGEGEMTLQVLRVVRGLSTAATAPECCLRAALRSHHQSLETSEAYWRHPWRRSFTSAQTGTRSRPPAKPGSHMCSTGEVRPAACASRACGPGAIPSGEALVPGFGSAGVSPIRHVSMGL